jgi:hypothetical protein
MGWTLDAVRALEPHEYDELVAMVKESTTQRPAAE